MVINYNPYPSRQHQPYINSGEVAILLLEKIHLARVVVERARQGAAETGDVHAAVSRVNAVGKGKFGSGPAIVVLYRQLDLYIIDLANVADRARLRRAAVLVQVAHKRDQPTFKVEGG